MSELIARETDALTDAPKRAQGRLAQRLRSGGAWVTVGRGLGVAGSGIWTLLGANLLAPIDFGAFVLIQGLVTFVSRFLLVGMNQAAVRFIAESLGTNRPARAQFAARRAISIVSVATLVVLPLSFLAIRLGGHRYFPQMDLRQLAPWLLCSLVLVGWMQLVAESLRGFHELRFASLLGGPFGGSLANALFPLLVFIATRFKPATLLLVVQLHVTAMALSLPIGLIVLLYKSGWFSDASKTEPVEDLEVGHVLAVSMPLMISELLTVFMAWVDIWLAGLYCAPADVGYYGTARRLMVTVALPSQLVTLTILSSIPDLHVRGESERLQKLLRGAATVAAIPSGLVLLAFALFPRHILTLLFKPQFQAAAIPLLILSLGQIVVTITGPAKETLGLTGHHGIVATVNAIFAVLLAGGGLLAAQHFGLPGLAAVTSIVAAVQALILLGLSRSRLGITTHALIDPT